MRLSRTCLACVARPCRWILVGKCMGFRTSVEECLRCDAMGAGVGVHSAADAYFWVLA